MVILLWRTNWRNMSAAELSSQNVCGLERTLCYCFRGIFLQHVNFEGSGHSLSPSMEVLHQKVLRASVHCSPQSFASLFVTYTYSPTLDINLTHLTIFKTEIFADAQKFQWTVILVRFLHSRLDVVTPIKICFEIISTRVGPYKHLNRVLLLLCL